MARPLVELLTVSRDVFHYLWSKKHAPALRIKSGDRVKFEVNEVSSWQINKHSNLQDLKNLNESKLYPLAGPVYVEEALPGDALEIKIEEVKTADWGWSAIIPGLGLLPEFKEPFLWMWNLSQSKDFAYFKNDIRIPLRPFCGVMGVAPGESEELSVKPPGRHGGNMDIRHLVAGSTLVLPVWCDGALFSVGDIHAAQGDGEVCVTAIECPGEVTLRFRLIKKAGISVPRFITEDSEVYSSSIPSKGSFVTMGIAPDLMEASKEAVREMIDYLSVELELSREEAYILCSVAGDLRIHEIVDSPNWVVGFSFPRNIISKAT